MKTLATTSTLLPADIRAVLVGKDKLIALYEEFLVWATGSYGLTLAAALAKLPTVTAAAERNRAALSAMQTSPMKAALQVLAAGLVDECIISPRRTGWAGYAGHRAIYERFERQLRQFQADHLCGVRNCVNPYHIVPATKAENMGRAAALQAMRKTHCRRGHRLDAANIYVSRTGEVRCKQCAAASQRARRSAGTAFVQVSNSAKDSCISGHEFTPETTYIQYSLIDGVKVFRKRRCKLCWSEQAQRRKAAVAPISRVPSGRGSTHPKGRRDRSTRPAK